MSMPSSSASVVMTASSSPLVSRASSSRRCCGRVAGAVGRDAVGERRAPSVARARSATSCATSSTALRDLMKQIVRAPCAHELGDAARPPRPARCARVLQRLVDHRRVPHRDLPPRAGRAVAVDERDVVEAGQPLGELDRVGDRRAREQEARLGPVRGGDPPQPPQDVARRASRRRRGRRAPRRRRRRRGWRRSRPTRAWLGRIPTCSMSGFVRTRFARRRIAVRSSRARVAVVDRRAHLLAEPERVRSRAPGPGPAPSSGRGTARAPSGRVHSTSSVGRLKHSDLPDAVPVVTIVGPPSAASQRLGLVGVERGRSPRARSPSSSVGCRSSGIGDELAARARPRTPRARAARRRARRRAARVQGSVRRVTAIPSAIVTSRRAGRSDRRPILEVEQCNHRTQGVDSGGRGMAPSESTGSRSWG